MVIVLGAVISLSPFSAGMAWNWMQLAVGLRRLGHEVWYVEEVAPDWCVDRHGERCNYQRSLNRKLFLATMRRFGLENRACQIFNHGEETTGVDLEELLALVRRSDMLLNVAGHVQSPAVLESATRRVYFDQDPVYTQLWHAEYQKDVGFSAHDAFLTVGLNIGTATTTVPACGKQWQTTLPCLVLDHWPPSRPSPAAAFTTIASWGSFGDVSHRGVWYRSKEQSFRSLAELPRRTAVPIAVRMRRWRDDDETIRLLRSRGWMIGDAAPLRDLNAYRSFISDSKAEIGVAKAAYVTSRSGWFSDRSAHYLASAKPVLAQGTGFEDHLPCGMGLLVFHDVDDAADGIEEINSAYGAHCAAARELAHEHLDYRVVLPRLLEGCFQ